MDFEIFMMALISSPICNRAANRFPMASNTEKATVHSIFNRQIYLLKMCGPYELLIPDMNVR